MMLTTFTSDLPGIGGVIKARPEDFLVEETPLYEPCGEGEHIYLFIEKRNQTTADVARRLARAFHVGKRDVSYAGLKDKQAITRQHFSVHRPDRTRDEAALDELAGSPLKVLWAARHTNKLRRGHHAGNRFVIFIRQVQPAAVLTARRVLDRLVAQGVPNYIGPQRFGFHGVNDELGLMLMRSQWQPFLDLALGQGHEGDSPDFQAAQEAYRRGDFAGALEAMPRMMRHDRQMLEALRQGRSAKQAVLAIDVAHREFLVSALQSAMFNQVLDHRLRQGLFSRLVAGDLAWKHDSRAVFAVDEPLADHENGPQGRVAKLEVSPSGPMWGPQMTQAGGQVLEWERQPLVDRGIEESELVDRSASPIHGVRRPMRILIRRPDIGAGVDEHGPYVRVGFELERGGFATVVLQEIMKPPAGQPVDASSERDQSS